MAAVLLALAQTANGMMLSELRANYDSGVARSDGLEQLVAESEVVRALLELGEIQTSLEPLARDFDGAPVFDRFLLIGSDALPELMRLEVIEQEASTRFDGAGKDTMLLFHADFRGGVEPR